MSAVLRFPRGESKGHPSRISFTDLRESRRPPGWGFAPWCNYWPPHSSLLGHSEVQSSAHARPEAWPRYFAGSTPSFWLFGNYLPLRFDPDFLREMWGRYFISPEYVSWEHCLRSRFPILTQPFGNHFRFGLGRFPWSVGCMKCTHFGQISNLWIAWCKGSRAFLCLLSSQATLQTWPFSFPESSAWPFRDTFGRSYRGAQD